MLVSYCWTQSRLSMDLVLPHIWFVGFKSVPVWPSGSNPSLFCLSLVDARPISAAEKIPKRSLKTVSAIIWFTRFHISTPLNFSLRCESSSIGEASIYAQIRVPLIWSNSSRSIDVDNRKFNLSSVCLSEIRTQPQLLFNVCAHPVPRDSTKTTLHSWQRQEEEAIKIAQYINRVP